MSTQYNWQRIAVATRRKNTSRVDDALRDGFFAGVLATVFAVVSFALAVLALGDM